MAVRRATGLEVDDHLAALVADRSTEHEIDLARQQDRPVEWPLHARLGHRRRPLVERGEALAELRDPLDGETAQIGLVGRRRARRSSRRAWCRRRTGGRSRRRRRRPAPAHPASGRCSWIARWATCPLASAGDHANGSGWRCCTSHPEHAGEGVLAHEEGLLAEALGELLERRQRCRARARRPARRRTRPARRERRSASSVRRCSGVKASSGPVSVTDGDCTDGAFRNWRASVPRFGHGVPRRTLKAVTKVRPGRCDTPLS